MKFAAEVKPKVSHPNPTPRKNPLEKRIEELELQLSILEGNVHAGNCNREFLIRLQTQWENLEPRIRSRGRRGGDFESKISQFTNMVRELV